MPYWSTYANTFFERPNEAYQVTNNELQKVYDRAKSIFLDKHEAQYEPHLYTVYCTIKAYCELHNLPPPVPPRADWSAWMHDEEPAPIKEPSK